MVKPSKNLLLRNRQADFHETRYVACGTPSPSRVRSNDNPRVTLTYFTARSNLVNSAFLWEKMKTLDFAETIAACDLKVGGCRQPIEFKEVCEC